MNNCFQKLFFESYFREIFLKSLIICHLLPLLHSLLLCIILKTNETSRDTGPAWYCYCTLGWVVAAVVVVGCAIGVGA